MINRDWDMSSSFTPPGGEEQRLNGRLGCDNRRSGNSGGRVLGC
jgi:hypothetical protein